MIDKGINMSLIEKARKEKEAKEVKRSQSEKNSDRAPLGKPLFGSKRSFFGKTQACFASYSWINWMKASSSVGLGFSELFAISFN